jgi:hypothetical protein
LAAGEVRNPVGSIALNGSGRGDEKPFISGGLMKRALGVHHSGRVAGLPWCSLLILFLIADYGEAQAQSGAWTRKKDMPTGRAVISACVVNDTIYVIGGYDPNGVNYAANEAYHPATDTWKDKKPLPKGRAFLSTAAVNGIIYAIGGGFPDATTEVLAYNPVTDTGWTPKAPLLWPTFGASAAVLDGIIYNVAGNHFRSDCEAYNPATNTWSKKADIPNTAGGVMVTPLNGLLYAFGGGYMSPFSTVLSYNPGTDKWTPRASMPTPRATSQVCAVDGKIYVLGGYSSAMGEVLADVEVYDPATDSWVKKPDMPFKLTMFGAAVVNGKIYVIGGTSDWGWAHGKQVWEYDPSFHTDIAPGNVSGLWTVDKSPYQINGDITIPNDSTLTIQPGVEVVFMGHNKFNVQGRLLAVGTHLDSIRFTANDAATGWHGIRFVKTPTTNDTSRIAYCVFKHGKANTGEWTNLDRSGGAILISEFDKVVVSHCHFESNMNYGEMYETGGAGVFIHKASPTVTQNTFRGNTGPSDFAIKCVDASTAVISRNVITHSTSEWDAIVCEHTAENRPLVTGNFIAHNVSRQGGGGIGFYRTSNARVENNVIVHNRGVYGGIVAYECGSPIIVNNTIAHNSASYAGGGVACWDASPILINNILYGNVARVGPEIGIKGTSSHPVFLNCNVSGGKAGVYFEGTGFNYTLLWENNIDVDPRFVNAPGEDYRLSDSSLCIGAGADSVQVQVGGSWYCAPSFCFAGNPRPSPVGSAPDIGAHENLLGSPVSVSAYADDVRLSRHGRDTVRITARVVNPFAHDVSVAAILTDGSGAIIDSLLLKDDGLHGDDSSADGLWGSWYVPKKDDLIRVAIRTDDLTDGRSRTIPDAATMLFTRGALIALDAGPTDLGRISNTKLHHDTTFTVRNIGFAADSITILLDPVNVVPETAVSASPTSFFLAPDDSQKVTFSIQPQQLVPQYYYAMITVQPKSGLGRDSLSKWFTFQIVIAGAGTTHGELPKEYALGQNYPNPFNPSTSITYGLPRASHVRLSVYDVLGREAAVLVNGEMDAGYHEVRFDGANLSSGVYLYQLHAGDYVSVKRMLLVR